MAPPCVRKDDGIFDLYTWQTLAHILEVYLVNSFLSGLDFLATLLLWGSRLSLPNCSYFGIVGDGTEREDLNDCFEGGIQRSE